MRQHEKIYVAGHSGMVGSAIVRRLRKEGFENLLLRTSKELDLTRQSDVEAFFRDEQPEYVFLAAAHVGGIMANNVFRGEFIYRNLQIQTNVIHSAYLAKVRRLLFFSSSCVYPRDCPQPMSEAALWSGPLEPTNEPYAVAKLAGMSLCLAYNAQYGTRFLSVIPTNLYGPNDNYDPNRSHLVAALINRFHAAKQNNSPQVVLWGTGSPRREIMHVDDAAAAAVQLMQHEDRNEPVNIGTGVDHTVRELAELVKGAVDCKSDIAFDSTKPDGARQKLLDITRMKEVGWKAENNLVEGITQTYEWYLKNIVSNP